MATPVDAARDVAEDLRVHGTAGGLAHSGLRDSALEGPTWGVNLDPPSTLTWNLIVLIWWYLESNRGYLEGLGTVYCSKFEVKDGVGCLVEMDSVGSIDVKGFRFRLLQRLLTSCMPCQHSELERCLLSRDRRLQLFLHVGQCSKGSTNCPLKDSESRDGQYMDPFGVLPEGPGTLLLRN